MVELESRTGARCFCTVWWSLRSVRSCKYLQMFREKNNCFLFNVEGKVVECVAHNSLHIPFVTLNLDHCAVSKRGTPLAQHHDATFHRMQSSSILLRKLKNSQFSLSLFRMIHDNVEWLGLFFVRVSNHLRDPWYHNRDNHNMGLTIYSNDDRRSVVKFFFSTTLELAGCRHYTFVSHVAAPSRRSDESYTIILPRSPA